MDEGLRIQQKKKTNEGAKTPGVGDLQRLL